MKLKFLVTFILITLSQNIYAGFSCSGMIGQSTLTINEHEQYNYIEINVSERGQHTQLIILENQATEYESNEKFIKIYTSFDSRYETKLQFDFAANVGSFYTNFPELNLMLETDDIICTR